MVHLTTEEKLIRGVRFQEEASVKATLAYEKQKAKFAHDYDRKEFQQNIKGLEDEIRIATVFLRGKTTALKKLKISYAQWRKMNP